MKIILASQSPRRVFLMQQMGLKFDQIPSDFEEYFNDSRTSDEIAIELGLGKAKTVSNMYPDDVVVGSDLVIEFEGKQLGKPESNEDAVNMLMYFSGKSQQIISSVAVVCKSQNKVYTGSDTSTITFPKITREFAENYVNTHNILDRAGSYDIRHPEMQKLGLDIQGRLDTIIGLPTNLVAEFLQEFGIESRVYDVSESEFYSNTEF